jgi:type VI secretion system protein ImpM
VSDAPAVAIPGWYGKLPSLGDFATRRLPRELVQPWDAWLQHVLQSTRAALGTAWQERYVTMPIWRFALLPGLVGASGWAGVLMPSIDRVGRAFPLTIAAELPCRSAVAHAIFDAAAWFDELERAALSALDAARGPDDLDAALLGVALMLPASTEGVQRPGPDAPMRSLDTVEDFPRTARVEALDGWSRHGGWTALWWTRGRVEACAAMLTSAALPTPDEFRRLVESDAMAATSALRSARA